MGSSVSPADPSFGGHTAVLMERAATSPAAAMVSWDSEGLRVAHKGDWAAGWLNHPLTKFGNTSAFLSLVLKQVYWDNRQPPEEVALYQR